VAACRAALQEQTQKRVPLDWAATQNNLGNALRTLGERESGTTRLEEAVTVMKQAWNVYREVGKEQYQVAFESRLKAIEDLIELRNSA
jgi:Tetratricopeptide repeat